MLSARKSGNTVNKETREDYSWEKCGVENRRLIFVIGLAISIAVISGCAADYTGKPDSETFVTADELVQGKLVQTGDRVLVYTHDEKELLMILSHYDAEKLVGNVVAIYDRPTDKVEVFDEEDANNPQEISTAEISKVRLYTQEESTQFAPGTSNASGLDFYFPGLLF